MDCNAFWDRLPDLLTEKIVGDDRTALIEHSTRCDACFERMLCADFAVTVSEAIRPTTAGEADRRAARAARITVDRRVRRRRWLVGASAAVLLIAVCVFLSGRQDESSLSATEEYSLASPAARLAQADRLIDEVLRPAAEAGATFGHKLLFIRRGTGSPPRVTIRYVGANNRASFEAIALFVRSLDVDRIPRQLIVSVQVFSAVNPDRYRLLVRLDLARAADLHRREDVPRLSNQEVFDAACSHVLPAVVQLDAYAYSGPPLQAILDSAGDSLERRSALESYFHRWPIHIGDRVVDRTTGLDRLVKACTIVVPDDSAIGVFNSGYWSAVPDEERWLVNSIVLRLWFLPENH